MVCLEDAHKMSLTAQKWETYRFTSKEFDRETGLYYYGARYYEPKLSRWMSADPAGFELINPNRDDYSLIEALNWYSYVGNNPVKYVDPTGLTAEYEIDHENKQINIEVDIEIYGNNANQAVADEYKKGIEDAWSSDKSGKNWEINVGGDNYQVNFDVSVKVAEKEPSLLKKISSLFFGNKNYVNVDSSITRSSVLGGSLGMWRANGRNGKSLANDNPAAHEFGHLLGFMDRYSEHGGANHGWSGNIMAEPAMKGNVEQRNIDAIGKYLMNRQLSSGTLRSLNMRY